MNGLDRFAVIVMFIVLIMGAIFWLPSKLGLHLEDSTFCVGVAFIAAVAVVIWAGIGRK